MRKTLRRGFYGSAGAALVAVAAVAAIVFAGAGSAAVPPAGINCQLDGKISGRGATFQTVAQQAFAAGFTADVCGNVGDAAGGNNMVIYDAQADGNFGSGNGQRSASCRADAFAGSDIPYSTATLNQLNGAPGTINCAPFAGITPPYQPTPGPYPAAADIAAPIMSFPVAGSAVSLAVNLQAADCGGTKPTAIQLTATMVSALFGGDILKWDDVRLRAGAVNAALGNCHGSVTRVVRLDRSGTSQIFKNYLRNVDGGRTLANGGAAATCDPANTWSVLSQDANNQTWPTNADPAICSALIRGAASGNLAVLDACQATSGAICYADLPDAAKPARASLIKASVRNSTNTSFQAASVSTRANCNYGSVSAPGANAAGAVGLDPTDTWAFDNAGVDHSDATNRGSAYPICGMTWALVYTGLNDGSVANAITRLNADQRRTLYSYESYILSSAGQDKLTTQFYQSLPPGLISSLRAGFQGNF